MNIFYTVMISSDILDYSTVHTSFESARKALDID